MSHVIYTPFKAALLRGEIDFHTGGDDIRVILVMTNTTCDTEEDTDFIDQFTTLDEMDGANYARQALANEVVVEDTTNNRGEFNADDATFASLGNGTRQVQGFVYYKHVTNDTDSVPLCFIDSGGFPLDPNGTDLVAQWNAEGLIQTT